MGLVTSVSVSVGREGCHVERKSLLYREEAEVAKVSWVGLDV